MTQQTDASERYAELIERLHLLADLTGDADVDQAITAILALLADNTALREALENLLRELEANPTGAECLYAANAARAALASALPDPKENKT